MKAVYQMVLKDFDDRTKNRETWKFKKGNTYERAYALL